MKRLFSNLESIITWALAFFMCEHFHLIFFFIQALRLYEHGVEYFLHAIKYEAQSERAKVMKPILYFIVLNCIK